MQGCNRFGAELQGTIMQVRPPNCPERMDHEADVMVQAAPKTQRIASTAVQ